MKHHSTTFFCEPGTPLSVKISNTSGASGQTEWPVLLEIHRDDYSETVNFFLSSELQLAGLRNYLNLACDEYFKRENQALQKALEKESSNA